MSLHTESKISHAFFSYSSSYPIKMLATDVKMQKIKPGPKYFMAEFFGDSV